MSGVSKWMSAPLTAVRCARPPPPQPGDADISIVGHRANSIVARPLRTAISLTRNRMRLCRQGRDLDGIAEVLKSGDEMLGLRGFGTTIEVVGAQVLIAGAVLEHVVDGGED